MALTSNILKNKAEKITPKESKPALRLETDLPDFERGSAKQEIAPTMIESESKASEEQAPALESDLSGLTPAPANVPAIPVLISKSITLQKIESILEEDLEDIYFRLDSAHQRLFREEGERAARQIENILLAGQSIAIKILAVIKKWLQFIPGMNKFFVEQEAKIKTDKVIKINNPLPPQ